MQSLLGAAEDGISIKPVSLTERFKGRIQASLFFVRENRCGVDGVDHVPPLGQRARTLGKARHGSTAYFASVRNGEAGSPSLLNRLPTGTFAQP